ncbi:orotidine-5'-phosphate decarboxylase [Methanogenium cariaci]|uniref:orotidine-5'-phosphate decarboxylase n=1 Tax=Methanogenium cariaci TaxID=2197 RepID=UPI0009F96F86|nr:orotidine-5'-phosphate decarboxylase [Methanogenium cariaci]
MPDLILALDVLSREEALSVAEAAAPPIWTPSRSATRWCLQQGLILQAPLSEFGIPLIADFKVADIPNTNRLIAEQVFAAGCSGIICQGFCGSDSVAACVEAADDAGGECYVVTEMSHPGALEFLSGKNAELLAQLAVDAGAHGIIAPATRPERVQALRTIIGDKKILSPGVGAQGGDPAVIAPPLIDGMIVGGRAIYTAEDPAEAARAYAAFRR